MKAPIRSGWATALWLGGVLLVLWLAFTATLTWCTAKTMDRYLEEENGRLAYNVANAAQLHALANNMQLREETYSFRLWDGANSNWLNNHFGGGLLRWAEGIPQTAVAIYDGQGNLLEKSETSFYAWYITEENWRTQESDMDCDGVVKVLYDPSGITETALQVIQRTDWIAMRFTGTIREGYLTPSKIEYIDHNTFSNILMTRYGDGSYERHQRIQQMEEKYGLTWETLLVSSYDGEEQQVYYTLSGYVSDYLPGESLVLNETVYADLMDYVLRVRELPQYSDIYHHKQGNLVDTLITDSWVVYTEESDAFIPAYRVVAAVRYAPMRLAAESLLYVYIGSFLLCLLAAVLLWNRINRNLILSVAAVDEAIDRGWEPIYGKEPRWREPRQLREQYGRIRTERAKNKDELSRLTAALQYAKEAEVSRRQMTSSIAHELKTPLAVIHSYAEGLKEHIAEDKRDKYIDVILSEVERTDAMVLEMLDLSRLEAGKVKLSREDFSVIALTKAVFEKLEMTAQTKALNIVFSFPKEFTITADEGRIAQVIENFATNAIKYTPAGGNILVKIRTGRKGMTFRIENDSEPLSDEALRKVWDTFYRTDGARSGGGTGLGLAIAKNIVELHGGTCSAQNTKTGVAFEFTI